MSEAPMLQVWTWYEPSRMTSQMTTMKMMRC